MGLFGKGKKRAYPPAHRCPKCGSDDVVVINGAPASFDSPLVDDVLGDGNTAWQNQYACNDCGYRWIDWE